MRAAFADTAIGNHLTITADALVAIELLQRIGILERTVFVHSLRPRHTDRARNVPAALRGLAHAGWRNHLAGELVIRTHVYEFHNTLPFERRENMLTLGANRSIRRFGAISGGLRTRRLGGKLPLFLKPFLAPAIHDADIAVAVVLQLPEGPGGEPIVVVSIDHNRAVVRDAGAAQQLFEGVLVHQVTAHNILKFGLPVPAE